MVISEKLANVFKRKRPVKYLLMRALKGTGLCIFFRIDRKDFSLRFYRSVLSGELWYDPDLRIADEQFFKRYLQTGDVVIDVGANIGELTLQSSIAVGQTGRIFSIEAHPRTFKYLCGNVQLNRARNVFLYNCAAGNDDGTINFSDRYLDDGNSVVGDGDCLRIAVCRLDNLPIDAPSIELLKVDVEGFEKFVFEGAGSILSKTKCIYFESWDDNFRQFGYCCNDLFELLTAGGFTIFRMLMPDKIAPISSDHHSRDCENLIAVREKKDFLKRTGFTVKD